MTEKVLYDFVVDGPSRPVPYRVLLHPMGQRELQWFYAGRGEWVSTSKAIGTLTDEILRLSAELTEARGRARRARADGVLAAIGAVQYAEDQGCDLAREVLDSLEPMRAAAERELDNE